jgi:predicted alpha/beta hydrolase family esterase
VKQVIVIHGATTFADHDQYLKYLAKKPLQLDRLTYRPMWKERLQNELGNTYRVLLPSMPNKTNARYSEWRIFFKNLTQLLTDDCVLVGHSMGAVFLAKYLSEERLPCLVHATVLIATPYSDESAEDLGDFKLDSISDLLRSQAGKVIIFNGKDDPVISTQDVERYKQDLPGAEHITLPASDHFMRADFIELTDCIKNL